VCSSDLEDTRRNWKPDNRQEDQLLGLQLEDPETEAPITAESDPPTTETRPVEKTAEDETPSPREPDDSHPEEESELPPTTRPKEVSSTTTGKRRLQTPPVLKEAGRATTTGKSRLQTPPVLKEAGGATPRVLLNVDRASDKYPRRKRCRATREDQAPKGVPEFIQVHKNTPAQTQTKKVTPNHRDEDPLPALKVAGRDQRDLPSTRALNPGIPDLSNPKLTHTEWFANVNLQISESEDEYEEATMTEISCRDLLPALKVAEEGCETPHRTRESNPSVSDLTRNGLQPLELLTTSKLAWSDSEDEYEEAVASFSEPDTQRVSSVITVVKDDPVLDLGLELYYNELYTEDELQDKIDIIQRERRRIWAAADRYRTLPSRMTDDE
jgi:hypothetical protein